MTNHIELIGNESRLAGKFRGLVDTTARLQDEMRRMKSAIGGGGVLTAAQRASLYNGGLGLAYTGFTT